MARLTRVAKLETREARTRLDSASNTSNVVHWKTIHKGLAIGYRRGSRGGVWMARRLIEGKYKHEILGSADDRADANGVDVFDYKQAHRKALEFSDQKTVSNGYTVEDAAKDYVEYLKAETKAAYQTETTINAHILPYRPKENAPPFKARRIDSLTTIELDRWKNSLVTAPIHRRGKLVPAGNDPETVRKRKASANRILTVFKALLNKAWENKKVSDNSEWKRVKPFESVTGSRKIFLQPDQCKRAINKSEGAFKDYVQALLYTGARPGKEVEFIRVRDFDPSGSIRVPDGKTGGRDVFLTDEAAQFFTRLTAGRKPDEFLLLKDDGTTWGKNHHRKPMQKLVKDAELPADTVAYSFRHTFISLVLKGGANIKVVADQCGTSIKMLEEHYAKFINDDRRQMFNAAMPSFGYKPDNVVTARR